MYSLSHHAISSNSSLSPYLRELDESSLKNEKNRLHIQYYREISQNFGFATFSSKPRRYSSTGNMKPLKKQQCSTIANGTA